MHWMRNLRIVLETLGNSRKQAENLAFSCDIIFRKIDHSHRLVDRIACQLANITLDRRCSFNNIENEQSQRTNLFKKKTKVLLYKQIRKMMLDKR